MQRALAGLAYAHDLAQRTTTEDLAAAGTTLAVGATQEQVRAAMCGLAIPDVAAMTSTSGEITAMDRFGAMT